MDVYLGCGLLATALIIVAFIIFDIWSKNKRAQRMHQSESSSDLLLDEPEFTLNMCMEDSQKCHQASENKMQAVGLNVPDEENNEPASRSMLSDSSASTMTADRLLILSVMAKTGSQFGSYDLLQALSAVGLQFGEMNIFHYPAPTIIQKLPLFSVASANKPGDFDLDQMGNFFCTGLMFFIDMTKVSDLHYAFKTMLAVAEQLAEDLSGDLCANPHVLWDEKWAWQYQKRIMHYKATRYDKKHEPIY